MTDLSTGATSGTVQAPVVVNTGAGPITLLEVDALKTRALSAREVADEDASQANSLRALAQNLWVQRGTVLISNVGGWSPSAPLLELVQQALPLMQSLEDNNKSLESIHNEPHTGIGGLLGKVGAWSTSRHIASDKAQIVETVNPLLGQIGRRAPTTTLPDADVIGSQAAAAETQANELDGQSKVAAAIAASTQSEIQRRNDSIHQMGFDALYLTAYLQNHGPQPIPNPLVPKRNELAYLAVPATLARQQTRRQWVGGGSGFSFPIGHTGIRYRVGSFRGHPIEQQFLGKLGLGTLVITNQRIAFIGATKSTSIPLAKLLHIEGYSDALAVFQEGRENPDFYFISQPKLALFWINWVLDKAAGT